MTLRREVDLQTAREVTKEMDAALDQLDREHKSLTSEAAMPELPNQSLAWEDLSALDRRTAQLSTWDGFNVPGSLGVAVCRGRRVQ